jgi:hypothetical protein
MRENARDDVGAPFATHSTHSASRCLASGCPPRRMGGRTGQCTVSADPSSGEVLKDVFSELSTEL